jgi:hypothetical protein
MHRICIDYLLKSSLVHLKENFERGCESGSLDFAP